MCRIKKKSGARVGCIRAGFRVGPQAAYRECRHRARSTLTIRTYRNRLRSFSLICWNDRYPTAPGFQLVLSRHARARRDLNPGSVAVALFRYSYPAAAVAATALAFWDSGVSRTAMAEISAAPTPNRASAYNPP